MLREPLITWHGIFFYSDMLRLPAVSRALAGAAHSKGSIATTNNGSLHYFFIFENKV